MLTANLKLLNRGESDAVTCHLSSLVCVMCVRLSRGHILTLVLILISLWIGCRLIPTPGPGFQCKCDKMRTLPAGAEDERKYLEQGASFSFHESYLQLSIIV